MQESVSQFHAQLLAILPRLRIYAVSLTRDRNAADDLVQVTIVKALQGWRSFQPGTNFGGWIFRIQRNEFISDIRRLKPTVPLDDAVSQRLSHPPHQEKKLMAQEFMSAFSKLAAPQREAIVLAVIEGMSYADIAQHTGVTEGTVKSRISRGRDELERLLLKGEEATTGISDAPRLRARQERRAHL